MHQNPFGNDYEPSAVLQFSLVQQYRMWFKRAVFWFGPFFIIIGSTGGDGVVDFVGMIY